MHARPTRGENIPRCRVRRLSRRGPCAPQYDEVAASTVDDILGGYNGTIFAYGQTGSGKSWSMMGPDLQMRGMPGFDHSLGGIIPRSSEDIFEKIHRTEGSEFTVQVSYLEVYRETIKDLLDATKTNLSVREGAGRNFYVEGLTEEYVTDAEDVLDALKRGDENRHVAATKMNAVSSRSHSVFMMKVSQRNLDDGSTKTGQLNLVDLAGSEKIQKTGATGQTLEEAKMINKSLSALSNVIKALADGKGHTPFRDSKLTLILRNSLGGNTKTSLLLAASPHPDNVTETISTLRFGERAKKIKTKVKANTQRSAAQLQQIVDKLQDDLTKTRAYVKLLEAKLDQAGVALPSQPSKADAEDLAAEAEDGAGGVRGRVDVTEDELELTVMVEQLKTSEAAKDALLRETAAAQDEAREAEATMRRAEDALIPAQIRLQDAITAKESVVGTVEELRRQLVAEKKSSAAKIKAEEGRSEAKKKQIGLAIQGLKQKVDHDKAVEKERTMALFKQMKTRSEEQMAEAQKQWAALSGMDAAEKQEAAVALVASQEKTKADGTIAEITSDRDRLSTIVDQQDRLGKDYELKLNDLTDQLSMSIHNHKDSLQEAETAFEEAKDDMQREHQRQINKLKADAEAATSEAVGEMERQLAETKQKWHQAAMDAVDGGAGGDNLRQSQSRSKVVRPPQKIVARRSITAADLLEPEPEPEHSVDAAPEGECLKQKPTFGTWPYRYIKIEGQGMIVFESKRKAEQNSQARGSSIRSLVGCKVTAGYEEFTFSGKWYKMTLYREDLDPPESNFCWRQESDRDMFLQACQNIAEGRDWAVNGTRTKASARKAARAIMAANKFGDAADGSFGTPQPGGAGAADGDGGGADPGDAARVSALLGRVSMTDTGVARAPEDGSGVSDEAWSGVRSMVKLEQHRSKYKLLAVLINDTEKDLQFVGSWESDGEWYEQPPRIIPAGSTASWGIVGKQVFTGESGPYGCVVYKSDGIEVVMVYSNGFSGQKISGGVYVPGTVRMPGGEIDPAMLHSISKDLLGWASQLGAQDDCHLAWQPPPFVSKKPGHEPMRCQWILSDEPEVVLRQLRPLLERASRSMLVSIENCTPHPLILHGQQSLSGQWRTEPPSVIKSGLPHLPTVVVFATESAGAGTDATVTFTVDIPVDELSLSTSGSSSGALAEDAADDDDSAAAGSICTRTSVRERIPSTHEAGGGVQVLQAVIKLRWVNPKIGFKGKWVEVVTAFDDTLSSARAGIVVRWDKPEQRDISRVTFRITMEEGAQPLRYMPFDASFDQSLVGKFSPLPPLPPAPPSSRPVSPTQLIEEGVPPEATDEAAGADESMSFDPSCVMCAEMESTCGICIQKRRSFYDDALASPSTAVPVAPVEDADAEAATATGAEGEEEEEPEAEPVLEDGCSSGSEEGEGAAAGAEDDDTDDGDGGDDSTKTYW